jgi:hypothetical protein
MNEEFYATVKLVSGEEIFSLVSPDEENGLEYLILFTPIKIIKHDLNKDYSYYKVEPWMKLTTENTFIIEKSRIITVIESFDEELINIYKRYINKGNNTRGNYDLTRSEGYITNIKQARMILEKIYRIK